MPPKQNPLGNIESTLEGVSLPSIGLSIVNDPKFFYLSHVYLSHDYMTQKTTIVSTNDDQTKMDIIKERIKDIGQQSDVMDIHRDPFIFVCAALSEVYESWVSQSSFYFEQLKRSVMKN